MALPTFLFAGILVFRAQITLAPAILIACCLVLYLSLISGALIRIGGTISPLLGITPAKRRSI